MTSTFYWNPRPYFFGGRLRKLFPLRRKQPVNNFGDLLGPLVVNYLLGTRGIPRNTPPVGGHTLFSIGSVLHFASDGDTVWGAGVNGKIDPEAHRFAQLDVRAVRGPRTRAFLMARGIDAPAVYGDPGLLIPEVMPHLRSIARRPTDPIVVVPNLHDYHAFQHHPFVVNPRSDLSEVLARIAGAHFVVGSSLHAMVIADALGIPSRLIKPSAEDMLKYHDYYEGTGRSLPTPAADVHEAEKLGPAPAIRTETKGLIAAFPFDLWP